MEARDECHIVMTLEIAVARAVALVFLLCHRMICKATPLVARFRAGLKIPRDAVGPQTLPAAGLLAVGCVGSVVTAHHGDAPPSPPCPQPKSLAAAPLAIFRQALNREPSGVPKSTGDRVRTVARRLQPLPIGAIHHTPCLIIKTSAVLMMFFGSVLPGHGQSAPTIGTQPLSQTNLAGTAVTFSVVVAGRGPRADSSERAGSWR